MKDILWLLIIVMVIISTIYIVEKFANLEQLILAI